MALTESQIVMYSCLAASLITLIANLFYFFHVIANTLLLDCGLKYKLLKKAIRPARQKTFFNLNNRLLFWMQISTVGTVTADLYVMFFLPQDGEDKFWLCQLQAIQMQASNWLVFGYSFFIALWLLISVAFGMKIRLMSRRTEIIVECVCHLCVWGITAVFTSLPFIGSTYGKSGAWCWIKKTPGVPNDLGAVWQLAAYYAPLWVILALVTGLYLASFILVVKSFFSLRKEKNQNPFLFVSSHLFRRDTRSEVLIQFASEFKIYSKIILFPAIFIFIWIFPTINRVYGIATQKSVFWLTLIHIAITPLHGFCNVVAYFLNPLEHTVFVRKILCCEMCNQPKQQAEEEEEQNDVHYTRRRKKSMYEYIREESHKLNKQEEEYEANLEKPSSSEYYVSMELPTVPSQQQQPVITITQQQP